MRVELIIADTKRLTGMMESHIITFFSKECLKLGLVVSKVIMVESTFQSAVKVLEESAERADVVLVYTVQVQGELCKMKRMLVEKFQCQDIKREPKSAFFLGKIKDTCIMLLTGDEDDVKKIFLYKGKKCLKNNLSKVVSVTVIKISGVSDDIVLKRTKDILDMETNCQVSYSCKNGEVHIYIKVESTVQEDAENHKKYIVNQFKKKFGNDIYSTEGNITLEENLVSLLRENHFLLVTAESCTGGMVASTIINVSGASEVLKQSFITYSNMAKREILGVRKETLKTYSEYSEQCAREMAEGAVVSAKSEVGISVTGVAGPDGTEDGKPAGLVYVGCCIQGKTEVREFHFKGNRQQVRTQATTAALSFARKCILKSY